MKRFCLHFAGISFLLLSHFTAAGEWRYIGNPDLPLPEEILANQNYKAAAAGGSHSVALKTDGTVVAWGSNSEGQCSVPTGLTGVAAIAANYNHTVVLREDGTVVGWGANGSGQITIPAGLVGVTAIATGPNHTMALKQDGTVAAWNSRGSSYTQVPAGLSQVVAIAAGGTHSAALSQNGTVTAWGNNGYGQTSVPSGLTGVTAIASGLNHMVALKQDGTVVAWGDNQHGQATVPAGLTGVVAISAGWAVTIAVKGDGSVVSWGTPNLAAVPTGLGGVTAAAAGAGHALALKGDGGIVAWGDFSSGQGNVPGLLTGVTAIAAGWSHTLGLRQDGTVIAWGVNDYGETSVPPGLKDVIAISAGGDQSMALKRDGTVVAWGNNGVVPAGLSGVAAIASGVFHHVVLKQDGTIAVWGNSIPAGHTGITAIAAGCNHTVVAKSDGSVLAFGRNDLGQSTVPAGLTGVTAVAAGLFHSVALKQDGTVVAWGEDSGSSVPEGLTGVVAIAAGEYFTIALKQDGTAVGWGEPWEGQISIPVGLPAITAIAAGGDASFLRTSADNGPQILQVSPAPIPSINAKQAISLFGSGFHPDCTVTLRDHRTGEVFQNRTKVSQTSSSIQLSVNFTAIPAEWSVEVENLDGQSSGLFRFQVGTPVVPGETVTALQISGLASIGSGETAALSAVLHYADGSQQDVTSASIFRIVGPVPEGVSLLGNELHTDAFTPTSTVVLSASFGTTSGGIDAATPHSVAIGGGFHAKIFAVTPEGDPFIVRATASVTGAGASYTYSWDFNGDGAFDDGPNQPWAVFTYTSLAGMQTVKVKVVSGTTGEEKIAERSFRLSKMLAINQPIRPKAVDVEGLGNFYDKSGKPFGFDYDRIGNGLIVLVHGMNSTGQKSWLGDLATAIEGAITDWEDSSALPNIVVYDWESDARNMFVEWPDGIDDNDLTDITAAGIIHGGHMANWIHAQAVAGLVDPQAPIHLIGHSAGGFVMGQAANLLNQAGIWTDRVTMLDTPFPWPEHIRELQLQRTYIDRLITSLWGNLEHPGTPPPNMLPHYTASFFPFERWAAINPAGHSDAHRRYKDTATLGHDDFLTSEGVSFRNSPFIDGPLNPNLSSEARGPRTPKAPPTGDGEQPITPLSTYGTTNLSGDVHTLIENDQTDSGAFAQLEIPVGAYAVVFTYRFQEGDEADRLVVSTGEDAVPMIIPNLPLYRTRDFQGSLHVTALGGSTVTLDIRLEGIGAANTSVTISNIKFLTSGDVDQDGLGNVQESALGSNPLDRDSDGDGISDAAEVNDHATSPVNADSDFDGVDDGVEIAAGTDPLLASSVFRITEIASVEGRNVSISFPCAVGKTYRLRGSRTPYGLTNWIVEAGIQSATGSATVVDTGRRLTDERFFYWVEVETTE